MSLNVDHVFKMMLNDLKRRKTTLEHEINSLQNMIYYITAKRDRLKEEVLENE